MYNFWRELNEEDYKITIRNLYRQFKFWINNGPKRLRSAKLRREGLYNEAMSEALGHQISGFIILDLIKRKYSPEERYAAYGQIARKMSAPNYKEWLKKLKS